MMIDPLDRKENAHVPKDPPSSSSGKDLWDEIVRQRYPEYRSFDEFVRGTEEKRKKSKPPLEPPHSEEALSIASPALLTSVPRNQEDEDPNVPYESGDLTLLLGLLFLIYSGLWMIVLPIWWIKKKLSD